MSELKVTPTGCPGPVAGSKVWRCDGVNCVYGGNQYASCKEEIANRGYTLRISNDIVEEAMQASQLLQQSVQEELRKNKQYCELVEQERSYLTARLIEERANAQYDTLSLVQEVAEMLDELRYYKRMSEDLLSEKNSDSNSLNNAGDDSDMCDTFTTCEVNSWKAS